MRVYAGASTSSMTLTVNGTFIKRVACVPGQVVSFGKVTVGSGASTYSITTTNGTSTRRMASMARTKPWVIGTMASHGCIRMYNKDVLELWPQVPFGTMVITRQ